MCGCKVYAGCNFVQIFMKTLFLFSPLYTVLTCPNSSVVRREELLVLVVLNLNRAGTTLAAESLASNVITQAATIIKPSMICR